MPYSQPSSLPIGQIPGTTGNTAAAAGNIGEVISAAVAFGSATNLTTGVNINLTSVSLTAGAWDIVFEATFNGGATTTLQYAIASISTVSTTPTASGLLSRQDISLGASNTPFSANQLGTTVGPLRVNLSATTTYFAIVGAGFGVSTANASGIIRATRVF